MKERLKNFLKKLNSLDHISFLKNIHELEDEYREECSDNLEDLESLELFVITHEKIQNMIYELTDKWEKGGIKLDEEEIEIIGGIGGWREGESINAMKRMIEDNKKILEFSGKKERLENIVKIMENDRDKIINLFIQHEKERTQLNQTNQSVKPVNNQSNKQDYSKVIIISMGAIIISLIGVIIFLLFKNNSIKKKKH